MNTPIDTLFAVEYMKKQIDGCYKQVKLDAEDYLASKTEQEHVTGLRSGLFGDAAGEFKYGMSREKTVTAYNLADWEAFTEWLEENQKACVQYILAHAVDFGTWWFEGDGDFTGTGELPEGISRVQYVEPSHRTAAKIYRPNYDLMGEVFRGGYLNETVQNMLGGADELPGD